MALGTWTLRTTPNSQAWKCVAWSSSLHLFVVAGVNDHVLTSPNGTTWTAQAQIAATLSVNSVRWCSGLGLFILAGIEGSDGKIYTSPNGITWTSRQTITGKAGTAVGYSPDLNLALVGASTGILYSSPDGTTWTDISAALTTPVNFVGRIEWAPGLAAPAGSGLTTGLGVFTVWVDNSPNTDVYVSTNGVTFAKNASAVNNAIASWGNALIWVTSLQKFIAIANRGDWIYTSSDGWTWTQHDSSLTTGFANNSGLATDGTTVVLVGWSNGNVTATESAYSADGLTWTPFVTPATQNMWGGIAYSSSLQMFCASAYAGSDNTSNVMTSAAAWWNVNIPVGIGGVGYTLWKQSSLQPSDFTLEYDLFVNGTFYPAGTSIAWVAAVGTPSATGWAFSLDAFAGQAYLVTSDSRPEAPRGFTEITTFATGSAGVFGGFPGVATGFNNRLVYAVGGYTVGTDSPTLRIYDGLFDRPIATIPNTSAGAVPKAIVSMITANGLVYFSTFDSGTSSADWVGRVFSLDIESGKVTQVGGALTTGHLPYALCWHAGRLWCGSHRQSSAASGKVFYIRPGIDSDWTADHDVTSEGMASVTALWSFRGKLYVGTAAAAASFAKVLERDTAGAYTMSLTLSGGTAAANNAVLSMTEFEGNLYVGYYNADTSAVASIRKFTGSAWSSVYSGSGETVVPYVALFTDLTSMFALGGGVGKSLIVLKTADGSSWTDETIFVPNAASTGVPAFGVVVH